MSEYCYEDQKVYDKFREYDEQMQFCDSVPPLYQNIMDSEMVINWIFDKWNDFCYGVETCDITGAEALKLSLMVGLIIFAIVT